jgi:tRNA pseudouridine13 synthase
MSETKRPVEDTVILQETKKQKVEETLHQNKGIQENDVGITSYISNQIGGFSGTLKQRYTDFLVNEIGLDGKVVHFEDDGIMDMKERRRQRREKEREAETNEEQNEAQKGEAEKGEAQKEQPKPFELDEEKKHKLIQIFGEDEVSKFSELIKTPGTFESVKVIEEKVIRGQVHQLVREAFGGRIETKTTPKNTFNFSLNPTRPKNSNRNRNRDHGEPLDTRDENGVENWGVGPYKPFLHFNLYKENKDTMEAASLMARYLKIQPRFVRFAGTKDRRGVTVQRICLSRFKVERVNSLNKALRGMKLGGFSYEESSLGLGDLLGNEFIITLRDVKSLTDAPIEQVISESLESLRENGFINYYGMQRFGTFSISTHTIGKEILLSNWSKAANLILSVQDLVLPESVESRKIWEMSRDASAALEKMPKKCIAEWSLLKHLSTCKKQDDGEFTDNDYFNALMKIPRNLRIMYGHAYQSYVWNCVASRRMELHGLEVVAGDLVIDETEQIKVEKNKETVDEDDFEEDVRTDKFQRARAVTQEEVEQKKFSIYDIVLPTPGFDINYPSNEDLFNTYKTIMKEDGMDPSEMYRKVREFSFAGSYRNLIAKPKNLEYHIRHYNEPTQQLVYTDLDLLKMKKAGESQVGQILPEVGGERVAIILKLQLDTSAYATMALREVMKADTSRHGEMCDVKVK